MMFSKHRGFPLVHSLTSSSWLADVDALLQFIDSYATSSEDSESHSLEVIEACSRLMAEVMPVHGEAFEQGLIPCARLIEVLAPPFLKLARKVSQEQSTQEQPTSSSQPLGNAVILLGSWTRALSKIMLEDLDSVVNAGERIPQVLCPTKRQELIKALVAAKFPEVRVPIIRHWVRPIIRY